MLEFHSLRYCFISDLTRTVARPKIAETLAQHKMLDMTLKDHTYTGNLANALEKLPALLVSKARAARGAGATRTDTLDHSIHSKSAQHDISYHSVAESDVK